MSMITFEHRGNFRKLEKFLTKSTLKNFDFDKYGEMGVIALALNTPVESNRTAESWSYEIVRSSNGVTIYWKNSNINEGVPIAVILQYGHGTRNGGYVQGRDYINPAIQPVFDKIINDMWEEVRST